MFGLHYNMSNVNHSATAAGLIFGLFFGGAIGAQAVDAAIEIKTVAQVEKKLTENGHERVGLVPASRVVPGDEVLYTVAVRNTSPVDIDSVVFTTPIPAHMVLVSGSPAGPGAEVAFSVDGGRTFGATDALRVRDAAGAERPARPADYTHLRWRLHITLRSHAVAYVRYRAVLQ